MTSRLSTAAPILAVLAIVLVTLGAYAGGYFWLGEYHEWYGMGVPGGPHGIVRVYKRSWQAILFQPAAWLESQLRPIEVEAQGP
jgi:hypothetical protein